MFVCICSAVTDSQINRAIDQGVTSVEKMQEHLGVANACGGCICEIKQMLQARLRKQLYSRSMPDIQPRAQPGLVTV